MNTVWRLALLLYVPYLAAGQPLERIDQQLAKKIAGLGNDALVQVIVVLTDQVDLGGMHQAFKAARATKEQRHYQVVTALQSKARSTQGPLAAFLSARQSAGRVESFEPMWIVNMVLLKATKQTVLDMARRADVEMIYEDGLLLLDAPVDSGSASSSPGAAEPNLRVINANRLWQLGYAGQGMLVMNIDTGVNGAHPGLARRWRGNQPGVLWYHAWYDQKVPPSPVPVDYGGTKHGSHTMGIMAGLDTATADTFGVAPRALWIASPTIDVGFSPHTSYTLRAFQWAADPDSNPSTADDVPDVISNSYQDPNVSSTQCNGASGYWAVVDALEAIGTAVTWSAGNAGSGAASITPPKNRITTAVNFFAVGNLNTSTAPPYVISTSSSRGPSVCDNVTIKPEVVAPGTSIRSSLAGNTYGLLSGTSMSSPHAAGAIALLRSANPSYTASEIKEILYNTAVDYGTPGEDNTYGKGLIDIWAAFQEISAANSRIEGTVRGSGLLDTLAGVLVENLTTSVSVQTNAQGFFRFILPDTGTYRLRFTKLGFATKLDTVRAPDDSTTYVRNVVLTRLPAPRVSVSPSSMSFTLGQGDSATRTLTVSNVGPGSSELAYRIGINGGFGGILEDRIGTTSSTFTGGALFRGNRYLATRRTTLKEIKSYHIISTSTDLRFAVYENISPTGVFTRTYDGPAIPSGTGTGFFGSGPISVQLDSGKYYLIGAGWLGSVTYYSSSSSTTPVGFGQVLSGVSSSYPPPATITISSTTTSFYHGAVVSTSGKFISVSNPGGDTLSGGSSSNHSVRITTTSLEPAGSPYTADIVVTSNDTLSPNVLIPVTLTVVTGVSEGSEIPETFVLDQNYPNPFNPLSTIRFGLPVQAHASLRIFDVLGREVRTLVSEVKPAGYHSVQLDGSNLASGVYFYRLASSGTVVTRRMLVLK